MTAFRLYIYLPLKFIAKAVFEQFKIFWIP